MLSNRGGVFVGTIWADVQVQGQEQTKRQLNDLNKNGKETASAFDEMTKRAVELAASYFSLRIAIREVSGAWREMISEDKAMRGAIAMMKAFGGYTEATAINVKAVADYWELFGKRTEETLAGFTQLYSVLRDTGTATQALNTAVKLSLVTQAPVSSVVDAIAKSYGNQHMQIRRLLGAWDEGAKSAETFAEFMTIAGRVGQTYAEQMNPAEQAQLRFNKAYKDLKVEIARTGAGPATSIFSVITEQLRILRMAFDENESAMKRWIARFAFINPTLLPLLGKLWGRTTGGALGDENEPWGGPGAGVAPWSMVPHGFTGPLGPGQTYGPKGKAGKAGVDWDAYNKWVEEQTQFGKDAEKRYSQIDEQGLRDRDARLKRMQDSWDAAHQQMFNTAEMFSNGVGNMFGDMVANGEFSFERLADYWKSMLAQMLSDLIASRIMDWLGTSITAGKWGGGARPGKGTEYGGQVNAGSFGGFRPRPLPSMPSGSNGVTVIIPAMSLLDAFNGSSVKVQNGVAVRIVTKGINSVAALS